MLVCIIFISFIVGTTTPKLIVEMMMTINNTSSIKPVHLNIKANKIDNTIIIENTTAVKYKLLGILFPSCSSEVCFVLNALKSISKPLKNIKNIKPNVDKIDNHASSFTNPNKESPMIIPIMISATTTGKKEIFNLFTSIGVKNAAITTITREVKLQCSILFSLY